MAVDITNECFNYLMALDKYIADNLFVLPNQNEECHVNVHSADKKEYFVLDISRKGKIEDKSKLQTRYHNNILIRLEVNCPEHKNPDGTMTTRNHIHVYNEKTKIRVAYNLDDFDLQFFKNVEQFLALFTDFCDYNKINQNDQPQGVL